MAVVTDSFLELVNKLCSKHVEKQRTHSFLVQKPTHSRTNVQKRLKIAAYDTLYAYLRGTPRTKNTENKNEKLNEFDKIWKYTYNLRQQRRLDDANRLEQIGEKLWTETTGDGPDNVIRQVLRLLVELRDTGRVESPPSIGHGPLCLPVVFPDQQSLCVLPEGPAIYGDSVMRQRYTNHYMHYPQYIFDIGEPPPAPEVLHDISILAMEPGCGLNPLFGYENKDDSGYEEKVRTSLFGALTESTVSSLHVSLDLPEILDETRMLELRIPKLNEVSDDKGFVDQTPSTSSGILSPVNNEGDEDFWDLALKYKPIKKKWETRAKELCLLEQPYLTEAGVDVFDHLSLFIQQSLLLFDPSQRLPQPIKLKQALLVKDIIYLMIGIPSSTFLYDAENRMFLMKPGVHMAGISHESLAQMCADLMDCGSNFCRLERFCQRPVMDSVYNAGLIFNAFLGGVRKFLQHYRGCVMTVTPNKTVMQLNFIFHKIKGQLRYLAELCGCDVKGRGQPGGSEGKPFPTGVKLLSYLYGEALASCSSENYSVLLSLLSTSAAPYLMFVQDWVFHGVCRDVYGEFMIKVNCDFLRFRDKHYWTQGYTLMSSNNEDCVPMFLLDLADQIFVCGKSINLLRTCNSEVCQSLLTSAPDCHRLSSEGSMQAIWRASLAELFKIKHFLFNIDRGIPRVMITFSEEDLHTIEKQCQAYTKKMSLYAAQHSFTRQQIREKDDQAKQDLIATASRVASQHIQELNAKIQDIKKSVDMKKRKEFQQLKSQMEKDLQRRDRERDEEKVADAALLSERTELELLEAQANQQLLQKAREEMIERYEKMSADAARREQRALWKVRRKQLTGKRRIFIQREEADYNTQMMELKAQRQADSRVENEDVTDNIATENADENLSAIQEDTTAKHESISRASPDLLNVTSTLLDLSVSTVPVSALHPENSLAAPTNIMDMSLNNLPKWAEDGLTSSASPVVVSDTELIDFSSDSNLPNWAKEGLKNPGPVFGLDQTQSKDLPSWAKKGLESGGSGEPLRVDEIIVACEENVDGGEGHEEVKGSKRQHVSDSTVGDLLDMNNSKKSEPGDDTCPSVTSAPDTTDSTPVEISSDLHDSKEIKNVDNAEIPKTIDIETGLESQESVETGIPAVNDNDRNAMIQNAAVDTHIKMVRDHHVSKQSEENEKAVPSIRVELTQHPSKESEDQSEAENKPHIKLVDEQHVNKETNEVTERLHIKTSDEMHATKESTQTSEADKPHVKMVAAMSTSTETEQGQTRSTIRTSLDAHSSNESQPVTLKIKPRSMFGHISEMSESEYHLTGIKLKRFKELHASNESDWNSYQMKPVRKQRKGMSVDQQTTEAAVYKPGVKFSSQMHSTKESDYVDHDAYRLERFRQTNIYGHSSVSTVQNILYGGQFGQLQQIEENESVIEEEQIQDLTTDIQLEPYEKNFDILDAPPMVDMMGDITADAFSGLEDYTSRISPQDGAAAYEYTSLPILLKKSITAPLSAQISLVNKSVVNYFLADLKIEEHFRALRSFIFMQDGEFGQTLSDQLFEKLSTECLPHELLNPAFLNNALNKAFGSSLKGDSILVKNFGFALQFIPPFFKQNAPKALDCLELRYKVDWPLNIVITENSMNKYSAVFSYLLQLKRIVWVLKDTNYQLKRDALLYSASCSPQFNQLQLYRHEMQHFVRVMQGYFSNQIIEVTWQEFMSDLETKVHTLNCLHDVHAQYLNTSHLRCLLNKKARPVMKVIQDIFSLILKFRMQLTSASWSRDVQTQEFVHPNFPDMKRTYKAFTDYSRFLFKVVSKLSARGYLPHLQELLLRLNFNGYYKED